MKPLFLIVCMLLAAQSGRASESNALIGSWKLISYVNEFQDGAPSKPMYGIHPSGYIIFTNIGRMAAVITGEGRKAPVNDQDRADLLRSMVAYSGSYRVEGDKWITIVDAAWNPSWNGTEQVRFFKLEHDQLTVTSVWQPNPNFPGAPVTRGILIFQRLK